MKKETSEKTPSTFTMLANAVPGFMIGLGIINLFLTEDHGGSSLFPAGLKWVVYAVLASAVVTPIFSILAIWDKEKMAVCTLPLLFATLALGLWIGSDKINQYKARRESRFVSQHWQELQNNPQAIYNVDWANADPLQKRALKACFLHGQEHLSIEDVWYLYKSYSNEGWIIVPLLRSKSCPEDILVQEFERIMAQPPEERDKWHLIAVCENRKTPRPLLERVVEEKTYEVWYRAKITIGELGSETKDQRVAGST